MKGTMAKWSKGILLLMAGLVIQGAGVCEMHAQSEASGKRLIAADVTKVASSGRLKCARTMWCLFRPRRSESVLFG
jgi:hypothetical protein